MYLGKHTVRWLLSCLIFLVACKSRQAVSKLTVTTQDSVKEAKRIAAAFIKADSVKQLIQTGDLIVRTGNDFTSESLRSFNLHDKTYSHCGIASIEHDTVFVYHALGGEWNPDQKIRKDNFKIFTEPYSNRGFAIYRYKLNNADVQSLLITVKKIYSLGIMFDMKFDLQTNDRMYCAEFVYKAYIMGTNGKLQFTTSHAGDFNFVGIDDLFLQPLCTLQKKVTF